MTAYYHNVWAILTGQNDEIISAWFYYWLLPDFYPAYISETNARKTGADVQESYSSVNAPPHYFFALLQGTSMENGIMTRSMENGNHCLCM